MKCKSNKFFKRNLKKKHKIFKKRQKYSLFLPVTIEKSPNFSIIDNATIYEENMFPKPSEREKEISFKISREELWEKWGITCISADTAFIILFVMYVFVVIYTLTLGIMQDTDLFDKK